MKGGTSKNLMELNGEDDEVDEMKKPWVAIARASFLDDGPLLFLLQQLLLSSRTTDTVVQ